MNTIEEKIKGDAPLRILLPSYRSDPHTGGQGIYMRLISHALVELGHKVDVISGPPYPHLDPRVNLIKLPSLDLYERQHPILSLDWDIIKNPTDLYEWWTHAWGGFPEPYTFGQRLAAYMKDKINDYDVMHDNQTLCYGMLAVRDMGLPVVGTIHHPITMDRRIETRAARNLFVKFLKWRWYSFVNMQIKVARALNPIIVVSDSTKRDTHREYKIPTDNMVRIHHGIDHDLFAPQPHITRHPNRLITTASADVPLKGLRFLISAYHQLLVQHPDLELLVIGRLREGPTMTELNRLGLRDRVKFVSDLSGEEIRDLYAQSTIAVSPSVYEGFGFPAGEALACGVPLVSTNGGSLPEIVGDAGVIVPHSNPAALADAIDDLLCNPEKRAVLSKKGRAHILAHFKWERCARDVVSLYRQIMAAQNKKV